MKYERGQRLSGKGGVLLLLTQVALVVRARALGNPVTGFDEQYYLLVGDRMLHGALPYVDIFDRKPIGLFLLYAGARSLGYGLGGDGFLAYKLVATGFVVATAFGIQRLARGFAGPFAAIVAAILYILWLNLMEGEGGQSPVFYTAPMLVAGVAVLRAIERRGRLFANGAVAMGAVGVALQIKYAVLPEGFAFGCILLWLGWRNRVPLARLAGMAAVWVGLALLPTVGAFATYAMIGQGDAWIFANIVSLGGQAARPLTDELEGLAVCVGILLPLALVIAFGRPWRHVPPARRDGFRFLLVWLMVSAVAVLGYGRFGSPHYALPVTLPAVLVAAPALARWHRGGIAALVLAILAAGQIVLGLSERAKGGAAQAQAVARAATPARGCLYVYDGYPALYLLTHSCLPSKWVFPGHLNTSDEASAAALGVDPVTEIRRILATRPGAIVDDYPRFAFGNRATRTVLKAVLAKDYHLSACVPTGPSRVRLVYRPGPGAVPAGCPSPAMLDR
ncbi:ArnT family glycosyltransferase [Sphingomonas sp. PB1R3]|uniref:ArnT family glycosyltransferase n=1 Tax=Sphingomonas flavida TaxID=3096154 RepID=UPI002FCC98CA